ncbi:MAG TPA: CHAP domain-containing protein, partial [Ktedonobacteraceae bacterium]
LPFPEDASFSHTPIPPMYEAPVSPVATRALDNAQSPNVTRLLPSQPVSSNLPAPQRTTTSLRDPVVIRATNKKRTGTIRPPRGRRMVIHVGVTTLLAFIVLGTLITVVPVGGEAHGVLQLFQPLNKMFNTQSNTTALIAVQAATATAVTQDGYDPGNYQNIYAGVPTPPPNADASGANHFYYGQCTWWAADRYHTLTGKWVPWFGNAYEWYYGALNAGWTVSATPHVPSIMVMMPGVQGASYGYGHVAVVEQLLGGGNVMTSNFNWGYGNWGVKTDVEFHQGSGIWFVSFPGM